MKKDFTEQTHAEICRVIGAAVVQLVAESRSRQPLVGPAKLKPYSDQVLQPGIDSKITGIIPQFIQLV